MPAAPGQSNVAIGVASAALLLTVASAECDRALADLWSALRAMRPGWRSRPGGGYPSARGGNRALQTITCAVGHGG